MRTAPQSVRVVTVNVHGGVPGMKSLVDKNEDVRTINDVAAYVRAIDADVILLQEVDNDQPRADGKGIPFQMGLYAAKMGAESAVYQPAYQEQNGDQWGNAILTRNGFSITQSANFDLPNPKQSNRAMGLARIVAPDGTAFTVGNVHLAARPDRQSDRAIQLAYAGAALSTLRSTGQFAYQDAISGQQLIARGFPTDRVILAGDFNTQDTKSDPHFVQAGLSNVRATYQQGRSIWPIPPKVHKDIDHFYHSQTVRPVKYWSERVPEVETPRGQRVTDHEAKVADLVW